MTSEATNTTDGAGKEPGSTRLASSLVAAGILLSRISGLIREAVFARYFGTTGYADVFRAGLRMPNLLQNLLGEGTLSASFIPVYAKLLDEGREEDAGRVAGAIFGLLFALAGALALFGVLLAPFLVSVLLYGFEGERRELAIQVVRIFFPMTGVLVLSAWALGILNSHRRFFTAYVAPVFWNAAIIVTILVFGSRGVALDRLVVIVAWGALLGGFLQFLVQLPSVLRLQRGLRPSLRLNFAPVRDVVTNAGPAIVGRGVVQLSGYVDMVLATLLAIGAVSTMGFAQTLYILPVSLFGMSVAAAELPELSRSSGTSDDVLRLRTNAGLERIAFFVVPSFIAFVALGDVMVAGLFEGGEFTPDDTKLVWFTLAALSIGLLASTGTRLFSSTFFALRDTKTPARFAITRVIVAAVLGFLLMTQFEPIQKLGIPGGIFSGLRVGDERLGAVGLALGSGLAAWFEWGLLRRSLRRRIGEVGADGGKVARMFVAALLAAAAGWGVRLLAPGLVPVMMAVLVFSVFGVTYFAVAGILRLGEADLILARLKRLTGRR